jgi:Lrp/AsnC family leucine-responsive transcriptional regulator
VKGRTHNMNDYRIVRAEQISTLPYVSSTSTYVAMQAVKETTLADVI